MIHHLKRCKPAEDKAEIADDVRQTVSQIIANIAEHGDHAVLKYSQLFDQWGLSSCFENHLAGILPLR